MKRLMWAFSAILAAPLAAEVVPTPDATNARIQTVRYNPNEEIALTALPMTGLTIVLEPGERIQQVWLDRENAFEARISAEQDGLILLPRIQNASAAMQIETDRRRYRFNLQTGTGLLAAYLVRLDFESVAPQAEQMAPAAYFATMMPAAESWQYRLTGDKAVQPASISDDGVRTRIIFGPEQALPGIFAIGPGGEEQVVNGYMRDDVFVIDRVWEELVFRIDKEKAKARRNSKPDKSNG